MFLAIFFVRRKILHEGHRQRMYEKLKNGDDLFDHEVLEILLFNACPRINTNPIAHALLDRFVSISAVLSASEEELTEVDGVGENIARFIRTVGLCAERAGSIGNAPALKTFGDCKRFIDLRLRGKTEEFIELYFLNGAHKVFRVFCYTTGERSRAAAKLEVIARNVALSRPYGIIIAHNHVDCGMQPSGYDDDFTSMVQFICNMNGCRLLDHLIYLNSDNIYSYKDDGRLEKIKNFSSWDKFEKWIKTLN